MSNHQREIFIYQNKTSESCFKHGKKYFQFFPLFNRCSEDNTRQQTTQHPFLANYLPTGHSELNVCLIFETQHHIFPQIQQTQWVILGTLKQISLEISNLFGIAPDFSVLISWSYPSQASAIIFWIKGFLIGTFASSCRRICSLHGTFPFKFLVMEYYKRIQHPRSLEDFLCGSCI